MGTASRSAWYLGETWLVWEGNGDLNPRHGENADRRIRGVILDEQRTVLTPLNALIGRCSSENGAAGLINSSGESFRRRKRSIFENLDGRPSHEDSSMTA